MWLEYSPAKPSFILHCLERLHINNTALDLTYFRGFEIYCKQIIVGHYKHTSKVRIPAVHSWITSVMIVLGCCSGFYAGNSLLMTVASLLSVHPYKGWKSEKNIPLRPSQVKVMCMTNRLSIYRNGFITEALCHSTVLKTCMKWVSGKHL